MTEHQDYYQKFTEAKDKMLDHALNKVDTIKNTTKETGQILDEHDTKIDSLNNRLSGMERKAEKTKLTMQRYLQRTSDCKLYVILGIEIFIFIVLMSI